MTLFSEVSTNHKYKHIKIIKYNIFFKSFIFALMVDACEHPCTAEERRMHSAEANWNTDSFEH